MQKAFNNNMMCEKFHLDVVDYFDNLASECYNTTTQSALSQYLNNEH